MDVFSLEDDDYDSLFITQLDTNNNGKDNTGVFGESVSGVLGDGTNFLSPRVSIVSQSASVPAQYSDISDDDFNIPSSQPVHMDTR